MNHCQYPPIGSGKEPCHGAAPFRVRYRWASDPHWSRDYRTYCEKHATRYAATLRREQDIAAGETGKAWRMLSWHAPRWSFFVAPTPELSRAVGVGFNE